MSALSSDVIFALSSAPARSALHVTRISGAECFQCTAHILRKKSFAPLYNCRPVACTTHYAFICDEKNDIVDDVIVTFFAGPKSYTGEDTLEISTHGNPLITARLHSLLRSCGARDAKPGEFTQRAFLNGKLDLVQAEAVAQLIDANTEGGIRLARQATEGSISRELLGLRSQLVNILAYLEAHIDFGADDVGEFDAKSLIPAMERFQLSLHSLKESYATGKRIQDGLKVALIGEPNVGKSSLYNALLKENRAIVTEVPGTTRDVLSERLVIRRRDFILLDTAGLRNTVDTVEKMGIERSLKAQQEADIVCYVISAPEALSNLDMSTLAIDAPSHHTIIVFNKMDLVSTEQRRALDVIAKKLQTLGFLHCALTSHADVSSLQGLLCEIYDSQAQSTASQSAVLISQRSYDKACLAHQLCREAWDLLNTGDYPEKVASVLNLCRQSLEEIVGEVNLDTILDTIFSSFCIGK